MWPFVRRTSHVELNTILEQQKEAFDAIAALNDQLSKFVRWSYRNQKSMLETLQKLQTESDAAREAQVVTIRDFESTVEHLSRDLLNWVDELDAFLTAASQGSQVGDQDLVRRWSGQVIERLQRLGFEELLVLGQPFDPRLAEALGKTNEWNIEDGRPPEDYEVISVLRRGFLRHGALYRKAQVVVYGSEARIPNSGGFNTDEP